MLVRLVSKLNHRGPSITPPKMAPFSKSNRPETHRRFDSCKGPIYCLFYKSIPLIKHPLNVPAPRSGGISDTFGLLCGAWVVELLTSIPPVQNNGRKLCSLIFSESIVWVAPQARKYETLCQCASAIVILDVRNGRTASEPSPFARHVKTDRDRSQERVETPKSRRDTSVQSSSENNPILPRISLTIWTYSFEKDCSTVDLNHPKSWDKNVFWN